MNSAAYRLISTNAKREATVNAEFFDRYSGARPEVIIPLPVTSEPPPPRDVEVFAPGQTVRLRRQPAAGMIGTIVGLHAGFSGISQAACGPRLPKLSLKTVSNCSSLL